MNAASLGYIQYAPDTTLKVSATFPDGYDLTAATAVFEIIDSDGDVAFRYLSGVDSSLSISGQVVTLLLAPLDESQEVNEGVTFASLIPAAGRSIKVNLDIEIASVVDKRFQADLVILPTHGRYTS